MTTQREAADLACRVSVGHLAFDALTEAEVIGRVDSAWDERRGGLIVTPNVDIWLRTKKLPTTKALVADAALVVADGAPIVWASKLARTPLPERVTGSSLIETLSAAAARRHLSAFVLGGGVGDTCRRAAEELAARHPGLRIAGVLAPPFGFAEDAKSTQTVLDIVADSNADLIFVGLGFPKQEELALKLRQQLPHAWLIGCGAAIAMAAGDTRRPPKWAQRLGLEWLVRLAQEPRRLARRYLIDDAPAAASLLVTSAVQGLKTSARGTRAPGSRLTRVRSLQGDGTDPK